MKGVRCDLDGRHRGRWTWYLHGNAPARAVTPTWRAPKVWSAHPILAYTLWKNCKMCELWGAGDVTGPRTLVEEENQFLAVR
jgi:hypothetical protein